MFLTKYQPVTTPNVFHYTSNKDTVVDVELPGVDPKDVQVTYSPEEGRIYLNGSVVTVVNPKYFEFGSAKAELKHGLLKVTIPQKKPERVEIPLTVA
jgi:HSP20 family molecular chaperone IbpA